MTYALGNSSNARLVGVHPRMVAVVKRGIVLSKVDFMVAEGLRLLERQKELFAQGRTKPGMKVTWTMNSKHLKQGDGYGHAVDLVPWIGGKIDWTPGKNFDAIAEAMFAAASELNTPIRWGADWDRDGKPREKGEGDSPHFELV